MWNIELPFNPMATPRPSARYTENKLTTFYNDKYLSYVEKVKKYIAENNLLNEKFYDTLESESGVVMEVDFFLKLPKKQKNIVSITRLSAPDIDNLLKSAMDCIFNDSGVKDSRVVGVVAFKYNTFGKPRTEVCLKKVEEMNVNQNHKKKQLIWEKMIPLNPMATPRPSFKKASNNKTITYYPKEYKAYTECVKENLLLSDSYNETFFEIAKSEHGTIAEIDYYCKIPKNQKEVKNIMKTTAPDIDNYVKGTLDSVFNRDLKIRDSRVVGLIAFKYNTVKNPRTEIKMRKF